jgi:hypothetical protein
VPVCLPACLPVCLPACLPACLYLFMCAYQCSEEDETWSKGIFTGRNLPPWKTITHDMWYIQEKKTGGLHQITASPTRHWGWTEKWHTSCPSPGQTH